MFHSLYKQQTSTQPSRFDWPAVYTGGVVNVSPRDWRLEVCGQVQEPKTFTFEELLALPQKSQSRRLLSVQGWSVRALWEGVLLQHLVEKVKPLAGVRYVRQTNLSGQTECLTLKDALIHRALLSTGVSGKRFTPIYGGPLCLMVFHRYSYKGLGQVTKLEFLADATPSDSEARGYTAEGEIVPGFYYAVDLRQIKPVRHAREVEEY